MFKSSISGGDCVGKRAPINALRCGQVNFGPVAPLAVRPIVRVSAVCAC